MTHYDAGHYAGKHPEGTVVHAEAARLIRESAADGTLTCARAHAIADSLGITPAQIGIAMDLCEVRLIRCQLGLFGHTPKNRIIQPAAAVSEELRDMLERMAPERRISCAAVWQAAHRLGISRREVAAACEARDIKIGPCQLGAF